MSAVTARKFMQVTDRFGKSSIMVNLPPTVIYALGLKFRNLRIMLYAFCRLPKQRMRPCR